MIWTDDLLDPETEEFANRKKEIEEEVIFCEIFTKFNQFVLIILVLQLTAINRNLYLRLHKWSTEQTTLT